MVEKPAHINMVAELFLYSTDLKKAISEGNKENIKKAICGSESISDYVGILEIFDKASKLIVGGFLSEIEHIIIKEAKHVCNNDKNFLLAEKLFDLSFKKLNHIIAHYLGK